MVNLRPSFVTPGKTRGPLRVVQGGVTQKSPGDDRIMYQFRGRAPDRTIPGAVRRRPVGRLADCQGLLAVRPRPPLAERISLEHH